MTIELLHPDDSGECADLGEGPTQDLRHYLNRRDTTDELTQNLGQYARPDAPFGYLRKTFDIDDTVIYRRDTVVYDQPPTVGIMRDLAEPQTERISLLGAVAGIDGDLRPAAPGPLPSPLPPPPPPAPQPNGYAGRHRLTWRGRARRLSPWWALAGVVLAGLAIWAGLILAGAAVIW